MSDTTATYAAALDRWLAETGTSAAALARVLDYSRVAVAEWRRGVRLPTACVQRRIYEISGGAVQIRCAACGQEVDR